MGEPEQELAYLKQQLLLANQTLRDLQALASAAAIEIDFTARKIRWTEESYKLFGLSTQKHFSLPGSYFFDVIHPEDAAFVLEQFRKATSAQTPLDISYRILLPDKTVKPIGLKARPVSLHPLIYRGLMRELSPNPPALETQPYSLIDYTYEAIIVINALLEVKFWNAAAEQLYGISAAEAVGKKWTQLVTTRYRYGLTFNAIYEELLDKQIWQGEVWQTTAEGKQRSLRLFMRLLPAKGTEELPDVIISAADISGYLAAEEQADKWKTTLDLLFDNIPGWIYMLNRQLEIMGCNRNFAFAMGFEKPSDLIGLKFEKLPIAPEWANKFQQELLQVLEGSAFTSITEPLVTLQGEKFWLQSAKVPLRDSTGNILGALVTSQDITEKRQIEEKLRRQEQQQERLRSLALIQGQEEERKRLAMDLHDGVGQMLTALHLQTDYLKNTTLTQEQQQVLSQLTESIAHIRQEIRRISRNLMPSVLSDFGIGEALEFLCQQVEQNSGIEVERHIFIGPKRYEPSIEVCIFRIAQEIFNNAVKYSKAQHLYVTLRDEGNCLELVIEDDGQGFDLETALRGQGLANIKQRAHLLNGSLHIDTAPGSGCRITAVIPYGDEVVEG
ncbi:MAG: PAS domain-containing protein [Cytophagales bacterium]|nr:PAS domain-containing protein [Bernardetiaceae bacterium]MDW8210180.1 PAS domain-containing protein [Cytophagales bacterium]